MTGTPSSASRSAVPPLAISSKSEPVQLLGERRDSGLVVHREERSLSCGDQLPARPRAAAGARRPVSRAASVAVCRSASTGTGSCRRSPPRCRSLRPRRCTVAAVSATPAARRPRPACAPGSAGSSAGCMLTTRPGNRPRNVGAEEVHVAGADDEPHAVRLEPVGHRRHHASSRSAKPRAGNARSGSEPARRARGTGAARRSRRRRRSAARIDQSLQVRSLAADEDADHSAQLPHRRLARPSRSRGRLPRRRRPGSTAQ